MSKKPLKHKYYEFVVTLMGVEPKIFRRFLLHKYSNFNDLHSAIQDACGWKNSHLFNFAYENPYEEEYPHTSNFAVSGWDEPSEYLGSPEYARDVRLGPWFEGKFSYPIVYYTYDYGDGWIHRVERVDTHILDVKFKRMLLGGGRAFPKEDSGGLPGYQNCVDYHKRGLQSDLESEEFEDWMGDWLGDWDPEAFGYENTAKGFLRPKNFKSFPESLGFNTLPENVVPFRKKRTQ